MRDLDPKLKLLEYGRGGSGVCGGHRIVDIRLSKLNDTYPREDRLMLAAGQEVESEYANTTLVFRLANSSAGSIFAATSVRSGLRSGLTPSTPERKIRIQKQQQGESE